MAYIDVVTEESATGLLSECFAADRRSRGFLPNLATTFGVKPEVYQAWRQLTVPSGRPWTCAVTSW